MENFQNIEDNKRMMPSFPQLTSFLSDLNHYVSQNLDQKVLGVELKSDHSPVTIIDRAISDFCKGHPLCQLNFFSEEEHDEFKFPLVVLDPIDGTKELIKGSAECSVSIAWMENAQKGVGLIYNPFTGFAASSYDRASLKASFVEKPYLGLMSRSEFSENTPKDFPHRIVPRGSIAFKLGLLASGASDFVVSQRPKNIWDIAAGTLILWQRGMSFYSAGKRVTSLDQVKYEAPLIWAREDVVQELNSYFSSPKGRDQ